MKTPYLQYDYYAGDIVKIWDCVVREEKFLYYYNAKKEAIASLFETKEKMVPQREAGIVLDGKKDIHEFKLKDAKESHTISLCAAADPYEDGVELKKISKAWLQIQEWQQHKPKKIKQHALLFPYRSGGYHWNLGVLWLTFSEYKLATSDAKEVLPQLIRMSLEVYEPKYTFTDQAVSTTFINKLQHIFKIPIKEATVIPTHQQNDSTSCGAISAQNGLHFLGCASDKGQSLLSVIYPCFAEKLRQDHVRLIGENFADIQDKEYKARLNIKDKSISLDLRTSIKEEFINYLKKLEEKQASETKQLFEELVSDKMRESDYARKIYSDLKNFLQKHKDGLSVIKIEKTNLFDYFLKPDDGWQEGAIDTLFFVVRAALKELVDPSIPPPGGKLNDHDRRSTLVKAFPGPLYQCLLALHYMLLLTESKIDFTIRMEDAHGGAFDDIIIDAHGRVEYIQVKHKYQATKEYEEADFTTKKSGNIELHKYFDDWYLFIKTAPDITALKDFTFYSNAKASQKVIQKYFEYNKQKECYLFKKINKIIKIADKIPSYKDIQKDEIVLYPVKIKDQICGFSILDVNNKLSDCNIETDQLTESTRQSLMAALEKQTKLSPMAEKEIIYLVSYFLFTERVIDKIEKNSTICSEDLFHEKIVTYFSKHSERKEDKAKEEKGSNDPAVAELRNRYKGYQGKKWQSLTSAEINVNIAEFLENLKFKLGQDHIIVLEEKVKQQILKFIGEEVSKDNVYYALIMEVHHWLCSMQAAPWDRATVQKKLEQFKKRYIDLLHKIGESQLSFRQINHLEFYYLYKLFAEDFNKEFSVQVQELLQQKEGGVLILSAKDENEGSILIEQYLQSDFNRLFFGQYLYFDGRYLESKGLPIACEKELELVVIDHVDDLISKAKSVGELWEAINKLLSEGKQLILISNEHTAEDLHKRFSVKLPIFPFNMKPLTKEQVMQVMQQAGGISSVSVGDKVINLKQAKWDMQSSVAQVFSHLPTLVHALTFTANRTRRKTTELIPLMLEEQISLYAFSDLLTYLSDYRQPFAIVISRQEELITLQSSFSKESIITLTTSDLLDREYKDFESWLATHFKSQLDILKKNQLIVLVDCRLHKIEHEVLRKKLNYSKFIILVNDAGYSNVPMLKLYNDISAVEEKDSKHAQELLFEFYHWHPAQKNFKRKPRTLYREVGENRDQLVQLAGQTGHIVICAEGGAGKSTITQAIYDDWCNESVAFPDCWLVLIELGYLTVADTNKGLIGLIRDRYALQGVFWQLNLLNRELQQGRIIFILDGWDELQSYQKKQLNPLIKKLIDYEKILWTTRPNELSSLPIVPRKQFNLGKFNQPKIEKFLQTRFPDQDFSKQALDYIVSDKNLLDLIGLPLHCHLLCEAWQQYYELFLQDKTISLPWKDSKKFNRTILYQEFIKTRLWRYLVAISKVEYQIVAAFELQQRIYLFCNQHLLRLQGLAYQLSFTQEQHCSYQGLIDDDLQKTAIVFSSELLGFKPLGISNKIIFHFTHQAYKEYLAAVYIVQELIKGDTKKRIKEAIKKYRYHPEYRPFWQFCAAIVSFGDPAVSRAKEVFAYFWQLLLAEPRDLIGVVERGLIKDCVNNTYFDDKLLIAANKEFYDQLVKVCEKVEVSERIEKDKEQDKEVQVEHVVSDMKSKDYPLVALIEFKKPEHLPENLYAKIEKLRKLGEEKYTVSGKLDFLRWMQEIHKQEIVREYKYIGECNEHLGECYTHLEGECNIEFGATRVIERIAAKILNSTSVNQYEFFNNPDILMIAFNILYNQESKDTFKFIKDMQPTTAQVKQMLSLLTKPTVALLGTARLSTLLIEAILTCLMRNGQTIKEKSSLDEFKKILAKEVLEEKDIFSKDSENSGLFLKKLGCCCILRQHNECDNQQFSYWMLKLIQLDIKNLSIIFSLIKQLEPINDCVMWDSLVEVVREEYLALMEERLTNSDKYKSFYEDLILDCLLFLDYFSAIDDYVLQILLGYDLILMSIKSDLNIEKILDENKELHQKPILFKESDRFSIYGLSQDGKWQLTKELDADKLKELKFGKKFKILSGYQVPEKVYEEITLKKGHTPLLLDEHQDEFISTAIYSFIHTFNMKIYSYLWKELWKDVNVVDSHLSDSFKESRLDIMKFRCRSFIEKSLCWLEKINDRRERIIILKNIFSLYKKEFYTIFDNINLSGLLQLSIEIYDQSAKTDDSSLLQNIAQFIFDCCVQKKIAMLIDGQEMFIYFNKEVLKVSVSDAQGLEERLLKIRREAQPIEKLLKSPTLVTEVKFDGVSDEDFDDVQKRPAKKLKLDTESTTVVIESKENSPRIMSGMFKLKHEKVSNNPQTDNSVSVIASFDHG